MNKVPFDREQQCNVDYLSSDQFSACQPAKNEDAALGLSCIQTLFLHQETALFL